MLNTHSSNLLGLDYAEEAQRMMRWPFGIVDVHSHLNGASAVRLYADVAKRFGVQLTYSMTALENLATVRDLLGEAVRFIAIPRWGGDPLYEHGKGYVERIKLFHAAGSRIVKFWAAPRVLDYGNESFKEHPLRLNSPLRKEGMKVAKDLGMRFMVHLGDPDTWFATRYLDANRYGTKRAHYEALEEILDEFQVPTIAAHMGGSPEDLTFLSQLLARHPLLCLDTSATKWMVRELSKHAAAEVLAFLKTWKGRILFGSDIVTMDEHLLQSEGVSEMAAKASTQDEAFDLYASRYWALRTFFESNYDGESPIADPDLHMVDPKRYSPTSAPRLRGVAVSPDILESIYSTAANRFFEVAQ